MKKEEITKIRITNALIQLLDRYPLENISITLLCDKAQVSRSAFYNNYAHIEDVLKQHYSSMHYQSFKHQYQDVDYMYSDQHIKDFIQFFDLNSNLLNALQKWDLFSIIAKYNTELVIEDLKKSNSTFVKENAYYFMIYNCTKFFYLGLAWIANNKKETPQELFNLIKKMDRNS